MPRPIVPPALLAGLAGALAMTAIHETTRRVVPDAPRLDSLGRRGLARVVRGLDQTPPDRETMQVVALLGDVAFNAGLFAATLAVGSPRSAPARGLVVGTLAGLATLELPPWLGIGPGRDELPIATQAMTVGLYAGGGLVAGLVYRRFRGDAGGS